MKIFSHSRTRLLVGGARRNLAGFLVHFPTLWLAMPTLRSKIYQSLLCRAVGLPGPQSYKVAERR